MRKSEDSLSFYKLFFNEELYNLNEKKPYALTENKNQNILSESKSSYNAIQEFFEGITAQTLIMFNYPSGAQMPAGDKVLLGQVLKAVGLDFESVSRLNTSKLPQNIKWEDIAENSQSDFVICLGVDKKYMPDHIGEGQIYNINGKRALCAASLSELILNNSKKKLLWQGLKEIYGI